MFIRKQSSTTNKHSKCPQIGGTNPDVRLATIRRYQNTCGSRSSSRRWHWLEQHGLVAVGSSGFSTQQPLRRNRQTNTKFSRRRYLAEAEYLHSSLTILREIFLDAGYPYKQWGSYRGGCSPPNNWDRKGAEGLSAPPKNRASARAKIFSPPNISTITTSLQKPD